MSQMSPLQKRLLEMMKFFHAFCESNNLRYYAVSGTVLGAIRHQGFIPWDDDIDVGMPRKDYERFLQLFGNSMIDRYVVESASSSDRFFCYPYAKLYDTSTTLIEDKRIPVKRGIFIDVFPLDGAGQMEEEAKKHFAPINRFRRLLVLKTIKPRYLGSRSKTLILRMVQALPEFTVSVRGLRKRIDEMCKQRDFDQCSLVGSLTGVYGWKEVMPRSFFGKPLLQPFETTMVYVPEDYEGYLAHLYGDWRKLPPKEDQVTQHEYLTLDLDTSYLD